MKKLHFIPLHSKIIRYLNSYYKLFLHIEWSSDSKRGLLGVKVSKVIFIPSYHFMPYYSVFTDFFFKF